MKRIILFVCVLAATLGSYAQDTAGADAAEDSGQFPILSLQPFIGYLSYDQALKSMPQMALVEQRMDTLRTAYEAELKLAEDEFNKKYELFLEGRKDFPRTIMLKRQTELEQLMQRNIAFKEQGRRELRQARQQALEPLRNRLNEVIALVAREHGLVLVVNTDADATPFIDPQSALDISQEVIQRL